MMKNKVIMENVKGIVLVFWIAPANIKDITFTGYDIVQAKIENSNNIIIFYLFQVHNLVTNPIAKFDLILCRNIMMQMTVTDVITVIIFTSVVVPTFRNQPRRNYGMVCRKKYSY